MSEREQNWYPIGEVGWFTGHVREGVEVTTGQLDLLRRALAGLVLPKLRPAAK